MPAGKTYVKIASQTLSGASASVTFSNLPQNYTDLVVVVQNTKTNASNTNCWLRLNGDSSTIYSNTRAEGDGSTAASYRRTGDNAYLLDGMGSATGQQSNITVQLMNYSNSSTFKTLLSRVSTANTEAGMSVGLYRSTSAITSLNFFPNSGNWGSGSTFTIYGIEAAKSPKADGGEIYSNGTHWFHVFRSSGVFRPNQAVTADYLVVAGGGGGGSPLAGGGGAGGLRSTVTATGGGGSLEAALSLSANTDYTVTVGAGGSAGGGAGTNGSNSVFSTITSTGGGRGGYYLGVTGFSGGSGGGGGGGDGVVAGGSGTANQGYAGGSGNDGAPSYTTRVGGGGGGAGAAGANGVASSSGGNGGAGVQITALSTVTFTGVNGYYAGGGGGSVQASGTPGTGGAGGGGNGGANTYGTSGISNTGGGGGAVGQPNGTAAGNGGSGIVIVRYSI